MRSKRCTLFRFIEKCNYSADNQFQPVTGKQANITVSFKTRIVSLVCSHEVLPAFCFVSTCNESNSSVDLKVHNMLLDQNCITAVHFLFTNSVKPREARTRHMLFAVWFFRFDLLQIHCEFNHFSKKNDYNKCTAVDQPLQWSGSCCSNDCAALPRIWFSACFDGFNILHVTTALLFISPVTMIELADVSLYLWINGKKNAVNDRF